MIGMDNKLKSSGAPAYAKVSDTAVTNANNNMIASTAGAGRAAQQKMGGRGMSAGRGQQARSERAQDDATIKGYVGAAKNDMAASQTNAAIDSAYDNMRANNQLGTQGMLAGLRNAQAANSMIGGQHTADYANMSVGNWQQSSQHKLDRTPLLRYLTS